MFPLILAILTKSLFRTVGMRGNSPSSRGFGLQGFGCSDFGASGLRV